MKLHAKIIFDLLRVKQWPKNALIYAALVFTSNLFDPMMLLKVTTGFFLFCFAASSIYIFNDLRDAKEDKHHPEKKYRPLASGAVKTDFAIALAITLLITSLAGSFIISLAFFAVVAAYIVMMVLYTLILKHIVILDIFIIAAGFVLRAISGAYIINVAITEWFLICISLGALFIGLAKRRYEINSIADPAKHRKILEEYSMPLLDEMISVVTASTVIAYSLYTFTSQTSKDHRYLMLTIPFVLYGIFRYLYLIHKKNLGGSPETLLFKDKPLLIDIMLWAGSVVAIVYLIK